MYTAVSWQVVGVVLTSELVLVVSSSQIQPVNPKPFLADLTGKPVMVRLKWGMEVC